MLSSLFAVSPKTEPCAVFSGVDGAVGSDWEAGVGVFMGVGVGTGVFVGEEVGVGVGVFVGDDVGVGVGVGVGWTFSKTRSSKSNGVTGLF